MEATFFSLLRGVLQKEIMCGNELVAAFCFIPELRWDWKNHEKSAMKAGYRTKDQIENPPSR
jgi:hypothetical protein